MLWTTIEEEEETRDDEARDDEEKKLLLVVVGVVGLLVLVQFLTDLWWRGLSESCFLHEDWITSLIDALILNQL